MGFTREVLDGRSKFDYSRVVRESPKQRVSLSDVVDDLLGAI
jgi:hypothetical protein